MDTAQLILTRVAAELPSTEERFTARDLEKRVVSTAHRLYESASTYAAGRQAKAAFTLAPPITPGASHTTYRRALLNTLV